MLKYLYPFLGMFLVMNCSVTNDPFKEIAEAYIRISFEVEKYQPGFVDAYFGPEELKTEVESSEKTPLTEIAEVIKENISKLEELRVNEKRRTFLIKQFTAIHTSVRKLSGEDLPFDEEVRLTYDIEPVKVPVERYTNALNIIDKELPGKGELADRLEAFQRDLIIPEDRVLELFQFSTAVTRERAKENFPLPASESFEIELVTDKPWSGYNWFKGNSYSLIQLNVDLPRRVDQLLHLMTHEGYPGHHTELTLREKLLYKEKGYLEYSIYPLYSPQSVISEGYADLGEEILFSRGEIVDHMKDALAMFSDKDFDFEKLQRINNALQELDSVFGDAAIMLLGEGISEDEVFAYIRKYGLVDEGYARKRIEFIKTYRGYIFNYHYGYELLKKYFRGRNLKEEVLSVIMEPAYPSLFRN